MTDLLPSCATGTHAPQTPPFGLSTCCDTPGGIASIDFQLRMIVAVAPTLDAEQLEASRATYRASVARRKELVAADPHAIIRQFRDPRDNDRHGVDCACGWQVRSLSTHAQATKAHTDHVRNASLHETPCVCGTYDRCKGVRAQDAARSGNWRDLHRAYND